MFLCCEISCYLIQSPRCDQVLTGILPYDGSDRHTIVEHIKRGVRPPRPADQRRNRWLQDPVWDVITTGWSETPEERCETSVVHRVFLASSNTAEPIHLEQPDEEEGYPLKQSDVKEESPLLLRSHQSNQNQASVTEARKKQRRKIIPLIASFFQFLRDSEPEIERRVNEMDKVRFSTPPMASG